MGDLERVFSLGVAGYIYLKVTPTLPLLHLSLYATYFRFSYTLIFKYGNRDMKLGLDFANPLPLSVVSIMNIVKKKSVGITYQLQR